MADQIDEITPNIALPLPNKENELAHDVERLRDALILLDSFSQMVIEAIEDIESRLNNLEQAP